MQQRDRQGASGPFFEGEGAEVAVHWPPLPQAPTPLWVMLLQRGAPPPSRHHDSLGGSAAVSRPSDTAAAGCGGCKTRGGALAGRGERT
jgi:hypothetical protein